MKHLSVNQIREMYLVFFESKAHKRLNSFSLIPHNDPSLLLINAGMTPMKKWFTRQELPPSPRVTTCQKCIRTPDIDQVGMTARHGTYFEMLGNFSFGDYFKEEAITWAWELLTEKFEMPAERLYATVYKDDDEAYALWHEKIGMPADHILRNGKEDNFWEHGTGPCGPCSEIFFDRGEKYSCGPDCHFGDDCDRFVEIWNLVFSQFDRQKDGSYEKLKYKNIDTGAGLERFALVLQEVDNFFEVDNIRAILDEAAELAQVEYGKQHETDVALRVVTDHIRSATMMISDGVIPSNAGRGYILRRLLRRAVRYGRKLNMPDHFLEILAKIAIRESEDAYSNLKERQDIILTHIRHEEDSFNKTLNQGLEMLEEAIRQTESAGDTQLSGEVAFKLHDTYGFPYDLTREICQEKGIKVDQEAFLKAMQKQQASGRQAQLKKSASAWATTNLPKSIDRTRATEFLGYDQLDAAGTLLHILVEENNQITEKDQLMVGEKGILLFDRTPFYGEGGGQVGDRGEILGDNAQVEVINTTKTGDGLVFHHVSLEDGILEKGKTYTLQVNRQLRLATARNHTATHLLQKALRKILGNHVEQAGSFVDEDYLRFDFRHFQALTAKEIQAVEQEVNRVIVEDLPVDVKIMSLVEAKAQDVMALFSEKYGDQVRVVSVGNYSKELCGGTHLQHSSQACYFRIISEGGIASGVRRIEAITGQAAIALAGKEHEQLRDSAKVLKINDLDIVPPLRNLVEENKDMHKKLEASAAKDAASKAQNLSEKAEEVAGISLILGQIPAEDAAALREAGDSLKSKNNNSIILLASAVEDKVLWLCMAGPKAIKSGLNAGKLIRQAAQITEGGGGGRPDMAQAGGKNTAKIEEALAAVREEIKKILNS